MYKLDDYKEVSPAQMQHAREFYESTPETKRERIAIFALQGLLANPANAGKAHEQIALEAVHAADCLLDKLLY